MEVQPVYDQFREEAKNGGVVRMERVEYATSFLQQVQGDNFCLYFHIMFIKK